MAVSNKRQARYLATPKGKAAARKSKLKSQKEKRLTAKGRLELRIIKIRSTWGNRIAKWFEKQESICAICEKKKDKAPAQIKGRGRSNQLVIDHDHKYTRQQYKKSKTLLYEQKMYVQNTAKWQAANEWANKKGYKFLIITEKELNIKWK